MGQWPNQNILDLVHLGALDKKMAEEAADERPKWHTRLNIRIGGEVCPL